MNKLNKNSTLGADVLSGETDKCQTVTDVRDIKEIGGGGVRGTI